jgi:hypothetical protein
MKHPNIDRGELEMSFERRSNGLSCKQLQLSNTIRRLWIEHVLWTRFFIVSAVSNLRDLPFVTQRLLQNPVDFAKVLQPFYGRETAKQFERLLTEHLLIAAELVNALIAGKKGRVEELRKKWFVNAKEIAAFLACINPFWSERTWRELLFDHLRMTENEAVLYFNRQFEKSIKEYDAIQAEALEMAEEMTFGIIRQFCIR